MIPTALTLILATACGPKQPPPAAAEPPPEPVTTVEAVPAGEGTDGAVTPEPAPVTIVDPAVKQRRTVNKAVTSLTNPDNAPQVIQDLETVVNQDASNVWAWFNLGLAYEITGQDAKARQSYLGAIDADRSFGPAYVNIGALDMAEERYRSAEANYRSGLRFAEENMQLWTGLIASLRAQGRLADAEVEAKKALQVDSNAKDVYAILGMVYVDQGKLDLADFIIQKALTVEGGDNSQLHMVLGRVYQLQDKPANARDQYEKALELNEDLVSARIWLSDYYLDNRNYEDTVPLLEKARELDPLEPAIYYNLGIAYRGYGQDLGGDAAYFEKAKGAYLEALKLAPTPELHLNLGILYGDYMKEYDLAVEQYELYKTMGGTQPEIADGYIEATLKEQDKVRRLEERRKRLEEDKKRREAEEAEAASNQPEPTPEPTPAPAEPAPAEPAPAEPAPEPSGAWDQPAEEAPAEPAPAEPAPEPAPETPGSAWDQPAEETPAEPAPAEPAPETPPADDNPWGE